MNRGSFRARHGTTAGRGAGCTVVDVRVRAGEPSDAAFIVEMARLASVIEDHPLPPADDPALVRGLPLSPDTAVLALDHDDHPVGAAWWHFRDRPLVVTPGGAQVPELVVAVTPSARGRGVGRALLDALTTRAAEHGYDRVALNVHIRNPAARLYRRAGFVVAGMGRGPLGVTMVRQPSTPDGTKGSGETGRFAKTDDPRQADSPEAVARIITQMAADLSEHPGAWENNTLERFLEALAAVVEDVPDRSGHDAQDATAPSTWQMLAVALVVATGYE